MKRPQAVVAATVVLVALSGSVIGIVTHRTLSHVGDEAVRVMTHEELAFLEKLRALRASMVYSDVEAILGPPDRDGLGLRPTWIGPGGTRLSQVAVYFTRPGGTVRSVRWLKIGGFVWESSPY